MAEDKEEKLGDLCHVSICVVENGYKISCSYESKDKTLAQRAGWVPCMPAECKDYVEKTKAAVLERLKKVL
jgi:hypothetical protein